MTISCQKMLFIVFILPNNAQCQVVHFRFPLGFCHPPHITCNGRKLLENSLIFQLPGAYSFNLTTLSISCFYRFFGVDSVKILRMTIIFTISLSTGHQAFLWYFHKNTNLSFKIQKQRWYFHICVGWSLKPELILI